MRDAQKGQTLESDGRNSCASWPFEIARGYRKEGWRRCWIRRRSQVAQQCAQARLQMTQPQGVRTGAGICAEHRQWEAALLNCSDNWPPFPGAFGFAISSNRY